MAAPGYHSLIALLALLVAGWCSPARAQSDEARADLVVRIAGRPEYSRTGTTGVHIWQKPVRYAVIGEARAAAG